MLDCIYKLSYWIAKEIWSLQDQDFSEQSEKNVITLKFFSMELRTSHNIRFQRYKWNPRISHSVVRFHAIKCLRDYIASIYCKKRTRKKKCGYNYYVGECTLVDMRIIGYWGKRRITRSSNWIRISVVVMLGDFSTNLANVVIDLSGGRSNGKPIGLLSGYLSSNIPQ